MRRILLLLAALAALVPATPVFAGSGCGMGWDLVSVQAAIDRVDERIYTAAELIEIEALVRSVDEDQDGLLCVNQFKPSFGRDKHWIGPEDGDVSGYVVTGIQDNHPKGPKS